MQRLMKPRRAVELLTDRKAWIDRIIETRAASDGALGHYRGESKALEWALPILADLVEREADSALNVHRQRVESALAQCAASALLALRRAGEPSFNRLIDDAPQRVVSQVERELYGARVPDAAPTGGGS